MDGALDGHDFYRSSPGHALVLELTDLRAENQWLKKQIEWRDKEEARRVRTQKMRECGETIAKQHGMARRAELGDEIARLGAELKEQAGLAVEEREALEEELVAMDGDLARLRHSLEVERFFAETNNNECVVSAAKITGLEAELREAERDAGSCAHRLQLQLCVQRLMENALTKTQEVFIVEQDKTHQEMTELRLENDELAACVRDGKEAVQGLSLIHISEPTRLLSISYAVFCLKKKKKTKNH
eukprot:TRINITY_DN7236_c0_g1_i7.p1 TRINITY_DN7236_c0_g1~~TRINITY_DN7236_c0_g1_i7.p1  ORF type:complete len:244 (-),score=99.69 TRINITY_DN7236_c0_g1_i7:112-843(-)